MSFLKKCVPIIFAVALVLAAGQLSANDQPTADKTEMEGKVSQVTLYRTQALVTRTLKIDGAAGQHEIIVGSLPQHVVADSLFAEGDDQLEVRAVQFRTRAVGASPREEVRKLQQEIELVQEEIDLNKKNVELTAKQTHYLDQLEGFVAPTATTEMTKGVLDAKALQELTRFSFDQRKEIVQQQVALNKEAKELQKKLSLFQRQLAELTTATSKTVREAVLFVQKNVDDPQEIRLNYLVGQCGWSPSYTVRADDQQESVKIEYNGLIYQMSGEAWTDVALTLSTASPAISASRPGLAPFRVALQMNGQNAAQAGQLGAAPIQLKQILSQQKEFVDANRNAINFQQVAETSWGLNDAVNKVACVELIGDSGVVNAMKAQLEDMSEEPSLSYKLASTVSLPSRQSQQMVRVLQSDVPSKFYHVATPVLTSYVYREAELTNGSKEDLLAGPITVYHGGRFVGRGEIPTVARGQSFVVGFGADPQLRARRELADKRDGINGGNRELEFDYRLVIENFKDEAVNIRLIDRLPIADSGNKIRVTISPSDQKLSDDPQYRRLERPEGILRWDVAVAARANGEEAKNIDYGYTVEYDRNYQVSIPGSTAQLRQQFDQLQRSRTKR